eukprot:TRINITY_DN181_c0_g2_i1.p1 TRINITY_DN181_c0_g2~~TRINITY_DN181_c0_g2_i1.p1  ORF type:complete len:725 (+),score=260.29 TRINITY_DN181_c0_g2_i1:932-3106(+)
MAIVMFPPGEARKIACGVAMPFAANLYLYFHRHDFVPIWFDNTGSYGWFNMAGAFVCVAVLVRIPIARFEQTELSLLDSLQESSRNCEIAEAGMQAKAAFLATMSHEIRTPLNGVIGMVQLLASSPLNEDQQEIVRAVRLSGDSLLLIVNDILDHSKIEAGKLQLDLVPLNIEEVAEESMASMAALAADHAVRLVCDVAPDVPRSVLGDPLRIRQCLWNLLSNACKFSRNGQVTLRVLALEIRGEASASPAEDGASAPVSDETVLLRLEVQDTGIGISPEQCKTLFDPFAQAERSTARRFGGTGLGLPICRQLISLMNGRIGVTSEVGHGSVFWIEVRLPILSDCRSEPVLRRFDSQVVPAANDATDSGAGATDAPVPVRVLCVDSSPEHQLALRHKLEPTGVELRCFEDAVSGLAEARCGGYDLLLLDWLSIRSEHEAEESGRLSPWTEFDLPIVVMRPTMRQLSICKPSTVAFRTISRPVRSATLVAAMHAVLRRRGGSLASSGLTPVSSVGSSYNMTSSMDGSAPVSSNSAGSSRSVVSFVGAGVGASNGVGAGVGSPAVPSRSLDDTCLTAAVSRRGAVRVLVADDNAINRAVLRRMLHRLGYEDITECENGSDALELLRSAAPKFDIAYLDISMPIMDGITACRLFREAEAAEGPAKLPVVALTANAYESDQSEYMTAGFSEILTKPLRADDLTASVQRWLPAVENEPRAGARRCSAVA